MTGLKLFSTNFSMSHPTVCTLHKLRSAVPFLSPFFLHTVRDCLSLYCTSSLSSIYHSILPAQMFFTAFKKDFLQSYQKSSFFSSKYVSFSYCIHCAGSSENCSGTFWAIIKVRCTSNSLFSSLIRYDASGNIKQSEFVIAFFGLSRKIDPQMFQLHSVATPRGLQRWGYSADCSNIFATADWINGGMSLLISFSQCLIVFWSFPESNEHKWHEYVHQRLLATI